MTGKFDIAVEGRTFAPGDWVRGRVRVAETAGSRALTVALHLREHTSDYSATSRTEGLVELQRGDLTAGASFEFAVQIPPDALPNYRSDWGELCWEIEAKSDRLGGDTRTAHRIEVQISR